MSVYNQNIINSIMLTRANIETLKTNSALVIGQVYLITDEGRIAIGTAINAYADYTKKSETDAKQATLVSGTNIKTINSNSLMGSGDIVIGGETANVETLTADKTLTASDAPIQIFTCAANRIVNLPTTGLAVGQKFEIWNRSTTATVSIVVSSTTIAYVAADTTSKFRWNGSSWVGDNTNSYNVAIGNGATVNYSQGVGIGASASLNYSYGVGVGFSAKNNNSYGLGLGSYADSNGKTYCTVSIGAYSKAERNREFVSTATQSDTNKAQMTIQKFREKDLSTAAAAWQELFIDASSVRLTIIASSVYHFRVQINAIDKTNFNVKTWTLEGAIRRNASNGTAIIGTVTKVVTSADAATTNWDVQATADDTNEALKIEVKHDSANQVRYSLNIWATETRI